MVRARVRVNKSLRENTISLDQVFKQLESKGYTFESRMVLYYSAEKKMFVYCGCIDRLSECAIPATDIDGNKLRLKCRKAKKINTPLDGETDSIDTELASEQKTKDGRKGKRTKERKISEIIQKVTEWRRLYSGVSDEDGNVVKYSLEEASNVVGIAKKTLDDYLLQLRFGKKYGFDFNIYKDEKVGTLRSFVKEKKNEEREKNENKSS